MIGAGFGLAFGLLATAPVQAVARDSAEPVIVELQLGRLTSRTVSGYRVGDAILLAAAEFFDLAEIRVVAATEHSVEAVFEPGGTPFSADLTSGRLLVGKAERRLGDGDGFSAAGRLYLKAELLGQPLDLRWNINWSDLTVTVIDPATLPVAERIARDRRRRTQRTTGETALTVDRFLPSDRRAIDGLVVDYNVFAPTGARLADAAYATALGLDVLGGSFTTTIQNQDAGGRQRIRADVSWAGVWRNRSWLTQLRLGDGFASGPRPRTVRGIVFGNSPYVRPNALGEVTFAGGLGPGWQVEAYRGGRLIGFDSVNALGRYAIDAPIAYGENPVEFVAYGPFGEVRRFNRTYRADPNRLPTKRFEYGAALGACRTDRCDATANLDLRYGLSRHWTAQAGLDQFWRADSLGALFHPYAGLAGALGNAVGVQLDAVANAILRAGLRYEPATSLILSAEATRFARGVRAPILTPDGRTSQLTFTGVYYPTERLGSFYIDGSIDFIRTPTTSTSSGRLGFSYQHRQLQFLPSVRWQRERANQTTIGQATFSLNTYVLPIPKLGPVFGQVTGRATIETAASLRPLTLTGYASRNLTSAVRLEIGGGWSRFQGATASLLLAANLATVRSLTGLTRTGGTTTGTQFVQGSLLYNGQARRLSFAAGPSLERAGLMGRVFLDRNGNDRFDVGEDLLPNVRVIVGMETRVSNRRGEYHLWNVTPHEPAVIAVDSTTLESPLWVPAFSAVSIEPGPNRYRVVDLPIAPGGVIDGRVVRAADSAGIAGLSLLLTNRATGAVRRIVSFSDGEFYLMGVKPGEYDLTLFPSEAGRLRLANMPLRVVIQPDPDGAVVSGLLVVVTPR